MTILQNNICFLCLDAVASISGICPCSKVGQWVGCKLEFVPKLDTTNKQSPNVKCPTMTILQNNICFLYLSLLYCIVNSFLDAVASLASIRVLKWVSGWVASLNLGHWTKQWRSMKFTSALVVMSGASSSPQMFSMRMLRSKSRGGTEGSRLILKVTWMSEFCCNAIKL